MIYNTKTKFRAAVEPEFPVNVGQMLTSYPQTIALHKLRQSVERKFVINSGAMYSGELEAMVLTPLYQAIHDYFSDTSASGVMVKYAYQLAAEFALIAEIAQVSQVKEVARELTSSAIQMSPVYQAFKRAMQSPDEYRDIGDAWKAIDQFLQSNLVMGSTVTPTQATPLYVLMTMQNSSEVADLTPSAWDLLVTHLKEGKGRPLSPDGATRQAMVLNSIWASICSMCDDAVNQLLEGDHATGVRKAAFADAWTALQWFDAYLEMRDQYDSLFPAAIMQQQSTAWVLALRNQALKYKSFFQRLSKVAQSFDVATFMTVWEEEMKFLRPALPTHLTSLSELDELWTRLKEIASKTLDAYSMSASAEVISELKAYLAVDVILPDSLFSTVSASLDDWKIPDPSPTANGRTYLTQGDTRGMQEIYANSKTQLLMTLTAAAGYLETALGFTARSVDVLSSGSALDSTPLLPQSTWDPGTKLEGKLGEYRYATFTMPHPVSELTPKYVGSEDDIHPIIESDVMVPKYVIPLQQERAEKNSDVYPDQAKICWTGGHAVATDIVSAAYARQPIPACYTWHRSASVVSATIDNYERLVKGLGGLQDCKDTYWSTLANIILTYRSTYGYSVLDMISAVMFVYVKGTLPADELTGAGETHQKDLGTWTWLSPRVPVIYGAPIKAFRDAQPRLNNVKSSKKKTVTVQSLDGSQATVMFVLHSKFPVPGDSLVLQYPMTPTSYVPISILKAAMSHNAKAALALEKTAGGNANNVYLVGTMDDLLNALRNEPITDKVKFVETDAFYPGAMVMPHQLWTWAQTSALLEVEDYKKAEMVRLRVRTVPLTGTLTTLTVIDNPIQVVSYDEYLSVMSSADPSPIADEEVERPSEEADNSPETSIANVASPVKPTVVSPTPVNLSQSAPSAGGDVDKALQQAGAVSAAPVLTGANPDGTVPRAISPKEPTTHTQVNPFKEEPVMPVSGDPASKGPGEGTSPAAPITEEYWKLVQDGRIVDVIKAKQAPAGYVPATAEEYARFSADADHARDEGKELTDEGQSK